jgi:uncharacterized Fe-S center protein
MRKFILPLALLALAACSPKYNWRDYSSPDAPFRAMFPDKPATHSREIDLDGLKLKMTMTASKVDDTTFAIGSAEAPDAVRAEAAVAAMKTAMVRNIGATIEREAVGKASSASGATQARSTAIDIVAKGKQNGQPMRLVGHFESRNQRIYQVIVIGPEKDVKQEQVDQFMSSFKLQ